MTFFFIEKPNGATKERFGRIIGLIRKFIVSMVIFVLFYWTTRLFSMKLNSKDIIYTKIGQAKYFVFCMPNKYQYIHIYIYIYIYIPATFTQQSICSSRRKCRFWYQKRKTIIGATNRRYIFLRFYAENLHRGC